MDKMIRILAAMLLVVISLMVLVQAQDFLQSDAARGLGAIIVVGAVYFLPYFLAAAKNHRDRTAIGALNLFLGWTLVGWVGAFVWMCIDREPRRAA